MTRPTGGLLALVALIGIGAVWGIVRLAPSEPASAVTAHDSATAAARERVLEFWRLYREATSLRMAGNTAEAAERYDQALGLNPDHEDALYYLGNMRLELGEFAPAERAWSHLSRVNPTSGRALLQLGALYLCFEPGAPTNFAAAAAAFERAHLINREETGPVLRLGEIALVQNDVDAALERFAEVIGQNATSVPAHFYRGYVAWRKGDRTEAAQWFGKAVELARVKPIRAQMPGEGDTKAGLNPLLAERLRCRDLEDPLAALDAVPDDGLAREMDARYQSLEALLAEARRANR
jgi:tetratricopeptide (TPR) repeat protein